MPTLPLLARTNTTLSATSRRGRNKSKCDHKRGDNFGSRPVVTLLHTGMLPFLGSTKRTKEIGNLRIKRKYLKLYQLLGDQLHAHDTMAYIGGQDTSCGHVLACLIKTPNCTVGMRNTTQSGNEQYEALPALTCHKQNVLDPAGLRDGQHGC